MRWNSGVKALINKRAYGLLKQQKDSHSLKTYCLVNKKDVTMEKTYNKILTMLRYGMTLVIFMDRGILRYIYGTLKMAELFFLPMHFSRNATVCIQGTLFNIKDVQYIYKEVNQRKKLCCMLYSVHIIQFYLEDYSSALILK